MAYDELDARVPPHNLEAELTCLGACLLGRPDLLDAVADTVEPADFYDSRHRRLYELILALRPGRVDHLAVQMEIAQRHIAADLPDALLDAAIAHIPNPAGADVHIQRVAHLARCRRAQHKLRNLVGRLYQADEAEYEAMVAEVAATLELPPGREFGDVRLLGEVALEDVAETRQRKPGQIVGDTWGYRHLDLLTSGLRPAKLYILAGRPGMGKSGLALEVVRASSLGSGKPWLLVTLEMMVQELAVRQIASVGQVDMALYQAANLKPWEWDAVDNAALKLAELPVYATDRCNTFQDVRRRAKWLQDKHRGVLGGVAVDYLQLLHGPRKQNDNREREVSALSQSLKELSRELACPVVALSQLNRALENRAENKRPKLSDLRESGSLEQDADMVLFLYREDYYDKNSDRKGEVELIVSKHRGGRTGTLKLHFKPEWQRFTAIEERYDA